MSHWSRDPLTIPDGLSLVRHTLLSVGCYLPVDETCDELSPSCPGADLLMGCMDGVPRLGC